MAVSLKLVKGYSLGNLTLFRMVWSGCPLLTELFLLVILAITLLLPAEKCNLGVLLLRSLLLNKLLLTLMKRERLPLLPRRMSNPKQADRQRQQRGRHHVICRGLPTFGRWFRALQCSPAGCLFGCLGGWKGGKLPPFLFSFIRFIRGNFCPFQRSPRQGCRVGFGRSDRSSLHSSILAIHLLDVLWLIDTNTFMFVRWLGASVAKATNFRTFIDVLCLQNDQRRP